MWPFKKTNPPVSFPPASEAVFEKIHQFLKSDHIQLAKYPEQMRARLLAGTDTDQNEGAFGAFGRTITNPIPVNGPIGEIIYLSALRRGEERIIFHRINSITGIDVYECVDLSGEAWDILYLDMYHPRKSKRVPVGYTTAGVAALLSGVNKTVDKFPTDLYRHVVDYTDRRFGMSLADPNIRFRLEKQSLERPQHHAAKVRQLSENNAPAQWNAVVEGMSVILLRQQIEVHTQLAHLLAADKPPRHVRPLELTFFVLANATNALFRWGAFEGVEAISDWICLYVIRLNLESTEGSTSLQDAIKTFPLRHSEYKSFSLYTPTTDGEWENNQFNFGIAASRNIIGHASPLAGVILMRLIAAANLELRDELNGC